MANSSSQNHQLSKIVYFIKNKHFQSFEFVVKINTFNAFFNQNLFQNIFKRVFDEKLKKWLSDGSWYERGHSGLHSNIRSKVLL